jgi:predicted transcriptional regulator
METLKIRIKSRGQADAEFIHAFKAAQAGKRVAPKKGICFASLEAVRALLTEKRLALLHLIRERGPKSISGLAKIAGRDFKNVHADVMLLKQYGLVRIGTATRAARQRNFWSYPWSRPMPDTQGMRSTPRPHRSDP